MRASKAAPCYPGYLAPDNSLTAKWSCPNREARKSQLLQSERGQMKGGLRNAVVGALLLCLLVSATSCANTGGLQQQFVDGFMAAHNHMATAVKLQGEAANEAEGGAYQSAAVKMAQAKTDAESALVDIPRGVVSDMHAQNMGVSEGKVVDLLSSRIHSFIDGAEHSLHAMQYAQRGDVKSANNEIAQSNDSFSKAFQAWYDLYDMVQTDANLSYLRDAMGW